ncbi:MAG: hypothetical protein Q9184_002149 [Pyrenodesmia sp. 2 TL-2023]
MAHRSWSFASKTDSSEGSSGVLHGLSTQQPLTPEELWDTYFGVGTSTYSGPGPKIKRMQDDLPPGKEPFTDSHLSLDHGSCLSCQQDQLNHSPTDHPSPAYLSRDCLTGKLNRKELEDPGGPGMNTITRCSNVTAANQGFAHDHPSYHDRGNEPSSHDQVNGPVSGPPQASALRESSVESSSARKGVEGQMMGKSTRYAQEGLLIALKDQTNDLLRTPMTPSPSNLVDADGFPPGVGKATNEISQGLFSDGTLFRDCRVPDLVLPKLRPPPSKERDTCDLRIMLPTSSQYVATDLQQPDQPEHTKEEGLLTSVRQREVFEEQQFRRLNQAPLSAIYEESGPSARAQHGCACQGCKDMPEGKAIIWFHLCERYKAVAHEKGIKYEPYEGRLVLHHSNGRSSIGLITEGPFEDRFVPAGTVFPPEAEISAPATPKRVRAPRPPRLELQSLHSGAGHTAKPAYQTSGPSKPAHVSTPALQRPISPTRVSRPSPLNQLPTLYCPESAKGKLTATTAATAMAPEHTENVQSSFSAVLEDEERRGANTGATVDTGANTGGTNAGGASTGASNTELGIHPALRIGYMPPTQWTTPPTRSQSRASFRDGSPQPSRSGRFDGARLSLGSSNTSGERPARIDSLGAPTNPGSAEPDNPSRFHEQPTMGSPFKSQFARHMAAFAAPMPLVSPSAAHEQTPSEYLCPSTPSTSSHDEFATQYVNAGKAPAGTAAKQEIKVADPFQASELTDTDLGFVRGEAPFSPQSYHTAPRSHGDASPLLPTALKARTGPSAVTNRLRSNDPKDGSPFLQNRAYHQTQSSKHSIAQSLPSINRLRFQRHSGRVSGTTLLNDSALDSAEETNREDADEAQRTDPGHERRDSYHVHNEDRSIASIDPLLTAGAAEARRAGILDSRTNCHDASPLQTIGATEAHCTDAVTSLVNAQHTNRRASVPLGQGMAKSSLASAARSNNDISPGASSASSSTNDLKTYMNSFGPAYRTQYPQGRSNMIDRNFSSHYDKLQAWLGIDASTTSASSVAPSPVNPLRKLQSMGMLDLLAADGKLVRKNGGVMKQVVKKGSQRFKEGREKFVGKIKKGLNVRPDDWLDSDDGRY